MFQKKEVIRGGVSGPQPPKDAVLNAVAIFTAFFQIITIFLAYFVKFLLKNTILIYYKVC